MEYVRTASDAARRWPRADATPAVNRRALSRALLIAAVCSLPVLLYVPFLTEPFMRDEGFYASVAQAMRHGAIPYEDAFDNKPPMVFAWYYASFALFGENIWAPRLLVSLLLSGATFLMYLNARLYYRQSLALAGAIAFGLSFGIARFETNANTEFFMLPAFVAMTLCFSLGQRADSRGWYLLSGIAAGVAIMTKQTVVFAVIFLIAYAAWPQVRSRGVSGLACRETLGSAGMIALGAAAAGLLVAAPFAWAGALPEMFEALGPYTLAYSSDSSTLIRIGTIGLAPLILIALAGPWVLFTGIGSFGLVRSGNRHAPLLLGLLLTSWLGIVAAGRFYDHYYVVLIPATALIIPAGIDFLRVNWSSTKVRAMAFAWIPLSILTPLYLSGAIYLHADGDARHTAKYSDNEYSVRETQSLALGDWIAERTTPSEYIYNLGFHSELYFYSNRRAPTRFMFDHPFMASVSYVEEAIADLEADRPAMIIDSATHEYLLDADGMPHDPDDGSIPDDADQYFGEPVRQWVKDNYTFLGQYFYADVYVLPEAAE